MLRVLSVLLLAALLPGCATITSGTSQSIAVLTEPPGASCRLSRGDGIIAVVNPTPGTVNVSKSVIDIAINCSNPKHSPGTSVVQSSFQAATLGNILIGGVIGLAVDAASGAMGKYPENVTVVMAPLVTPDETERDGFFSSRIADIRRGFDERIEAVHRDCPRENSATCEVRVDTLRKERDEQVRELDRQTREAPNQT